VETRQYRADQPHGWVPISPGAKDRTWSPTDEAFVVGARESLAGETIAEVVPGNYEFKLIFESGRELRIKHAKFMASRANGVEAQVRRP
jgi:hypothetical protein